MYYTSDADGREFPPFRPDPADFQGPALTVHEINDLVEKAIQRGNHPHRKDHNKKKRERKHEQGFFFR